MLISLVDHTSILNRTGLNYELKIVNLSVLSGGSDSESGARAE